MDLKKEITVKAYSEAFGNVTVTCKAAQIDRSTYYEWLKTDEEFKAAIEAVEPEEVFVDFAEEALANRIKKEDTTAIIFALKSKGKKRGYVERQEFTGPDGERLSGFNYVYPIGKNGNGNHTNGKSNGKAGSGVGQTKG